jgi:leader peptidase (prepilin peptidase)/N-methyltransferase
VTDLVLRRVPNRVVLPGYIVAATLLALALASATSDRWSILVRAGAAMLVLAALLVALVLAAPGGIGFGDCKRAGVVGRYLGWLGWAALSTGTLLAFVAAALFVIGRRVVSSPDHRMLPPFAPFMADVALVAILAFR